MLDIPRLDYEPRTHLKAFHNRTQRYAIWSLIEDLGKRSGAAWTPSFVGVQHVWPTGVNFAYVALTQKQAKLVAWPYLKDFAAPFLSDPRSINETELRMELVSGARIHVFGAESADNLRGIGLSGGILKLFAEIGTAYRRGEGTFVFLLVSFRGLPIHVAQVGKLMLRTWG